MNIVKSIASWLCLYLAVTCLFIAANVFAFTQVVNGPNIKETLREQGTYDKVVPAILSSVSYTENANVAGQLPLNEPWVLDVAKQAFPASDLEQKGNTVIDSTFAWLDGESAQPDFTLDFTSNKTALAQGIAKYSQTRLSGLPPCTLNNLPSTVDPFKVDCLPPGVNPQAVANTVEADVKNDQGFLKNPIISSKNLSVDPTVTANNATTTDTNPFSQIDSGGPLYQNRGVLLWILPIATILLSAVGILLANDRLKAMGRLARSYLTTGIGLLIFAFVFVYGLSRLLTLSAREALSKDVIAPLITELAKQAQIIYFIFAGISLTIAIVLFVARRQLSRRTSKPTTVQSS